MTNANPPLIVWMTDFGTQDSYVGVMKGVAASIAPQARLLDLTHQIRPQDVAHAAYTLRIAAPYFPTGTIFCGVVDPGVGSTRRAVAVQAGSWFFVVPDNGLLTRLLDEWPAQQAVLLDDPQYQLARISATFHGRDIFTPAAAHLAAGVPLTALGSRIDHAQLRRLPLPQTRREGSRLVGSVMHVDHFGNLITTITADDLASLTHPQVQIAPLPHALPVATTFADVPPGEPVAYLGSDNFLELAVRNGSATQQLGVGIGAEVVVEPAE